MLSVMCGRSTYKLTWEEIVALYRLTLDQPARKKARRRKMGGATVQPLGNFKGGWLFYFHAQRNHCHDTLGFRASTFGRGSFHLSLGRYQQSGLNWSILLFKPRRFIPTDDDGEAQQCTRDIRA
jgi:hypothetical protein